MSGDRLEDSPRVFCLGFVIVCWRFSRILLIADVQLRVV